MPTVASACTSPATFFPSTALCVFPRKKLGMKKARMREMNAVM